MKNELSELRREVADLRREVAELRRELAASRPPAVLPMQPLPIRWPEDWTITCDTVCR